MSNNQGLTQKEKKKLTIDAALRIAPNIIRFKSGDSFQIADTVAVFARDIVDAVDSILKDKTGNSL
jgi:hypothetical protein